MPKLVDAIHVSLVDFCKVGEVKKNFREIFHFLKLAWLFLFLK